MSNRYANKHVPAVPAHDITVVVGQDCDRCGAPIPRQKAYFRRDFTLKFVQGRSYPDGGDVLKGWELLDCCDACLDVLKALLIDKGFEVSDAEVVT